jgi:hypothetical protein
MQRICLMQETGRFNTQDRINITLQCYSAQELKKTTYGWIPTIQFYSKLVTVPYQCHFIDLLICVYIYINYSAV